MLALDVAASAVVCAQAPQPAQASVDNQSWVNGPDAASVAALDTVSAQSSQPAASSPDPADQSTTPETPPPKGASERLRWLDRTHQGLYDAVWHTAMRVDRWFGSDKDEQEYQSAYGSVAPAVLWDQHYHFATPVRFNINMPLPQINERFNAFIGRVNPNEYITEREQPSGAFRRQYGPVSEDETLFGLAYHEPERQGGHFDAGAGIRLTFPPDPFIKGSYVIDHGSSERGLLSLRETAFWQHTDGFGVTTRADLERIYNMRWLVRWTGSATLSQKSLGVLGWSAIDVMRGFAERRAVAVEFEIDGQTNAPVELHNYGTKIAYRKSILRRWLIMELRTGYAWPKDLPTQQRRGSVTVGVGFEMLFGTDEFLARPVTF